MYVVPCRWTLWGMPRTPTSSAACPGERPPAWQPRSSACAWSPNLRASSALLSICLLHAQPSSSEGLPNLSYAVGPTSVDTALAFVQGLCSSVFRRLLAFAATSLSSPISHCIFRVASSKHFAGECHRWQPCSRIKPWSLLQHVILDCCRNSDSSRQAEKRAAAGLSRLPEMYHQVSMRALHSSRFDDFDFGRHNPTRFAGLENEIANCYANALLQVCRLYLCLCERDHNICGIAECLNRGRCTATGNVSPSRR